MRIVGGRFKGRRLSSFKGRAVRPTSDRIREALFNILEAGWVFDRSFKRVLDLFAGTGAFAIEALSRGSAGATLVDDNEGAQVIIKKNLNSIGLEGAATVVKKDALIAINLLSRRKKSFDLIFLDPPYGSSSLKEALTAIGCSGLLSAGGVIVAEASKRAPLKEAFIGLLLLDERRYGDTLIYLFTKA